MLPAIVQFFTVYGYENLLTVNAKPAVFYVDDIVVIFKTRFSIITSLLIV